MTGDLRNDNDRERLIAWLLAREYEDVVVVRGLFLQPQAYQIVEDVVRLDVVRLGEIALDRLADSMGLTAFNPR
jgi:hypothetical protein